MEVQVSLEICFMVVGKLVLDTEVSTCMAPSKLFLNSIIKLKHSKLSTMPCSKLWSLGQDCVPKTC